MSSSVMEVQIPKPSMRKRIAAGLGALFDRGSKRHRHVDVHEGNVHEGNVHEGSADEIPLETSPAATHCGPQSPAVPAQQVSQPLNHTHKRPPLRSLPAYHGRTSHGNGQCQELMSMAPLDRTRPPRTLASLPLELLAQILWSLPSLADLKAAVHATSVFHQAYLSDRMRTLYFVLYATLGDSVFVDAYAVQRTSHFPYLPSADRQPKAERFITSIHRYHEESRNTILPLQSPECRVENLAAMSGFYFSTIRPLLQKVPEMFLQKTLPGMEIDPISTLETRRIMRALYRFELWCNLYGAGSDTSLNLPLPPPGGPVDILRNFSEVYEPWEIEEIDCIYTLLHEMYEGIFDEVRDRCDAEDQRKRRELGSGCDTLGAVGGWLLREIPPGGSGVFNYRSSDYFFPIRPELQVATLTTRSKLGAHRHGWRNGALAKGLKWHLRVMGASGVKAKLRMIMSEVAPSSGCSSLAHALSWKTQMRRRELHPSSRDGLEPPDLVGISGTLCEIELKKLLLIFGAGAEDKQPVGWDIVFRGKYCNYYGGVLRWELKCWGWVFWDGRRLKTRLLEELAPPWNQS